MAISPTNFVVEAYVHDPSGTTPNVDGYEVNIECDPDVVVIPGTVSINTGRSDYLFSGVASTTSEDQGDCCSGLVARFLGITFGGTTTIGSAPRYLGEFEVSVDEQLAFRILDIVNVGTQTVIGTTSGFVTPSVDGLDITGIVVNTGDIFPCGGNGQVDVDDILGVLRGFAGDFDCPPIGPHGCCTTGAAGCINPDVAACVCAVDPSCCDPFPAGFWDTPCVNLVTSEGCGVCCP